MGRENPLNEVNETAEVERLRSDLVAANELARVRGWHIAEIRKLHSWADRPTIAECICGLIICLTLRALSTIERIAPAGPVETWAGKLPDATQPRSKATDA
jgi:hypothetical protein